MNKIVIILIGLITGVNFYVSAQPANTGMTDREDSTEKNTLTIGGYIDAYTVLSFEDKKLQKRRYAVSSTNTQSLSINLLILELKLKRERWRSKLALGVGTYMNDNYKNEPNWARRIVEANVGILLSSKKKIWLDAGVIGSPYTNESPIAKDHIMYSRSLAAEYVPYYLTGFRFTVPLHKKVTSYFYLINGWQQIIDVNNKISFGAQVEWKINKKILINSSIYLGNEQSTQNWSYRYRYFWDIYTIVQFNKKWRLTADVYAGNQRLANSIMRSNLNAFWFQGNLAVGYAINKKNEVTARLECFNDRDNIILTDKSYQNPIYLCSSSLGFNKTLAKNVVLRFEQRNYFSNQPLFMEYIYPKLSLYFFAAINAWF